MTDDDNAGTVIKLGHRDSTSSEFYTVEELAAYLNVPVQTVYQWNSVGVGPGYYRIGKYVRYRKSEVEDWLDDRRVADGYLPPATRVS